HRGPSALARQQGAGKRRRGEHVVARHGERPVVIADVDHGAERHHVTAGIADLELLYGLRIHTKGGVGLDVDLPGAAKAVKVVYVEAAQVHLERIENVCERYA